MKTLTILLLLVISTNIFAQDVVKSDYNDNIYSSVGLGRNERPNRRDRNKIDEDQDMTPNQDGSNNEIIRIFPTYPGTTPDSKPEVKPTTPVQIIPKTDEKFDAIDKRIASLEELNKNNSCNEEVGKLGDRLNQLETKVSSIESTVDGLKTLPNDIKKLTDKIVDLETKISTKAEVKDVITPGKLDDFLKKDDAKKVMADASENIAKSVTEVKENTAALNTRVDQTLTSNNSTLIAILKDFKETVAKNQNQVAVNPETTISNIYNDFGQIALGAGIPSAVLLVIGYWFRSLAKKYLPVLIGHVGGIAQQIPLSKMGKVAPITPQAETKK